MSIEDSRKSKELFKSLLRMLEHLNFSEIRMKSHPNNSFSDIDKYTGIYLNYTPGILALKNEVEYLFEYVRDRDDMSNLQDMLHPHITRNGKRWDISLVLVTDYGNKDQVRQSAEEINLSFDQIWEI